MKWITREKVKVDCVASPWLIKKFIDPKARFVFATEAKKYPPAIPFAMFEVEFTTTCHANEH